MVPGIEALGKARALMARPTKEMMAEVFMLASVARSCLVGDRSVEKAWLLVDGVEQERVVVNLEKKGVFISGLGIQTYCGRFPSLQPRCHCGGRLEFVSEGPVLSNGRIHPATAKAMEAVHRSGREHARGSFRDWYHPRQTLRTMLDISKMFSSEPLDGMLCPSYIFCPSKFLRPPGFSGNLEASPFCLHPSNQSNALACFLLNLHDTCRPNIIQSKHF